MRDLGFDDLLVAPELEYYLFADSGGTEVLDQQLLRPDDARRRLRRAARHRDRPGTAGRGRRAVPPRDRSVQHEVDMRPASALKAADGCMTARITVKEIAMEHRSARDLHAETPGGEQRLRDAGRT